jgi:D-arabinose 1-dehydrogenase-like Zn-dependent alcohol dehydrogenase
LRGKKVFEAEKVWQACQWDFCRVCCGTKEFLVKLPERPAGEHLSPILSHGVMVYKALKICGWVVLMGIEGRIGALGIQKTTGLKVFAVDGGRS